MPQSICNFGILEAGWIGSSSLSTIASAVVAFAVCMIWCEHIKSKKKKFQLGFNKDTGLVLIFLSMALMIISSWI